MANLVVVVHGESGRPRGGILAFFFAPAREPRSWLRALRGYHSGSILTHLGAKAALVELGHGGSLALIASIQEAEAECQADLAENLQVLGPADHRSRRHHRGYLAGHEGFARQRGDADHACHELAASVAVAGRDPREHDLALDRGR